MTYPQQDEHRYDDIIDLPHPVSTAHPPMSVYDRAAQFSPFAALTGYEDAVKETARLTEQKTELDEETLSLLNRKMQLLQQEIKSHPAVSVTFFLPDEKKAGGQYITVSGHVKKVDNFGRVLVLTEDTVIPVDEIVAIEADLFSVLESE